MWRVQDRKFQNESTQIFNDKVFSGEVKKQEEGEGTFIKKKKGDSKHDLVKNVVFENKGEYVKGERKGRKRIIKSKRIFKKKRYIQKGQQKKRNTRKTDVQERDQKRRMSKKHKRRHTKMEKLKKKTERRTNMQKHTNLWRCLTKRFKAFENAKYVFLIDRDNKKRKKKQ